MTAPTPKERAADRELLADARYVVTGGRGASTARSLAYPLYVALIVGVTYGFTAARFLFVTNDPAWVRAHLLTPGAALLATAAMIGATQLVWTSSRRRGAAVPPLPWIDHVLASAIDRAAGVRPWWRLTLGGAATGLGLAGLLLGASLWASGVTGPVAAIRGTVLGALAGSLLAYAALLGQSGTCRPGSPARACRELRIEDLRAHAATSDRLVGALLAGDPRAEQVELANPPDRGRQTPLRAAGPAPTVLRRDILGQRRDPVTFWRGVALGLAGWAATAWTLVEPAAPPILAGAGLLLVHSSTSAWAEGLRMSADQLGAPGLFGLSPTRRALAHSLFPAAATLAAALVTGLAVVGWSGGIGALAASPLSSGAAAGPGGGDPATWVVLVVTAGYGTLMALATTWLAAYRPPASIAILLPGSGPWLLLARLVGPGLVAFAGGLGLPGAARGHGVSGPLVVLTVAVGWAVARMREASQRRPD